MAAAAMVAGTVISFIGQQKMADASKDAEKARRRAMNLDAKRKRLDLIREAQGARALALSNATAQGASEGTGLQGGYGQITGTMNRNLSYNAQDQQLGNQIFKANERYASASSMNALGQGITSLGQQIGSTPQAYSLFA